MNDRRGFLKGLFGGVVGGGLIIKATQADLEAFADPLKPNCPLMVPRPLESIPPVDMGEILFNHKGQPVAVVQEVHMSMEPIDISSAYDTFHTYAPGVPTIEIRAVVMGPVNVRIR